MEIQTGACVVDVFTEEGSHSLVMKLSSADGLDGSGLVRGVGAVLQILAALAPCNRHGHEYSPSVLLWGRRKLEGFVCVDRWVRLPCK